MEFDRHFRHRLLAPVALHGAQIQVPHHAHAQARFDRRDRFDAQLAHQRDQDRQAADDGA
ncbi:hypothetical protein LP420_03735 [Massilia sp. B-10]|nr:hypothetical protein LP420_03735 [Massilia sp. B-10]